MVTVAVRTDYLVSCMFLGQGIAIWCCSDPFWDTTAPDAAESPTQSACAGSAFHNGIMLVAVQSFNVGCLCSGHAAICGIGAVLQGLAE